MTLADIRLRPLATVWNFSLTEVIHQICPPPNRGVRRRILYQHKINTTLVGTA